MTDVILETRNLTKQFRGFTAVNEVNLKVRRGHIHALIGPNGAGKTTCFNLLTKFLTPTSGAILYNGQDITGLRPERIADRGVIRSFQISAVFPHLTVLENVRIGLQRALGTSFHFWKSETTLYKLNDRARELLATVDLESFADTVTVDLPYGRKRALQSDAHVLQHGQVREYGGNLERTDHAAIGDPLRPQAGDVLAVVQNGAGSRRQEFGQQIKTGGLAGAVRPD